MLVETALKIAVAVGISAGLFIAANKLFDLAYPRWAVFAGLAGAGIGFIAFFVLDANRALRDLPGGPWLWGLIGAVALGAPAWCCNAPSTIARKLPLSVVTFAALGVLIGVAVDDRPPPEIDWAQVLPCSPPSAVAVARGRRARQGRRRDSCRRAALDGRGDRRGGGRLGLCRPRRRHHGPGDRGVGRAAHVARDPRRPAARAHRSGASRGRAALTLVDLPHPGDLLRRRRPRRPADADDLPLVPRPDGDRVRRAGQLQAGLRRQGVLEHLALGMGRVPPLQAVLDGGGADRAGRHRRVVAGCRTRRCLSTRRAAPSGR